MISLRRRHRYTRAAERRLDYQARTIDCLSWQQDRQDGALTDLLGQVQDLEQTVRALRAEVAALRAEAELVCPI